MRGQEHRGASTVGAGLTWMLESVADALWRACPAAATVSSGSSACVASSGHAICASAASAWGSQKVISMARYRAMAAVSSVRAGSGRSVWT